MSKSQAMMTVRHLNDKEESVSLEKCFGRRALKRAMMRGGIPMFRDLEGHSAVKACRRLVERTVRAILKNACAFKVHSKTKTITDRDVKESMRAMGFVMVGVSRVPGKKEVAPVQ